MQKVDKVIQYILAVVGLLAAIIALPPGQWKQNILNWLGLVQVSTKDWWIVFLACMFLLISLLHYKARREAIIWPTRKKWWDRKLPKIILTCEKLVVVDSYQGSKHEFWASLEKRIDKDEPFHFIMLNLPKGSQMLKHCMETSRVMEEVADIDKQAIERLIKKRDTSAKGGNKTIEFGYWEGESQGPLVAWTIKGKEVIAAGLWQQVEGSTDLSPWFVVQTGPLYTSFKAHYESLIQGARQGTRGSNLHTSIDKL